MEITYSDTLMYVWYTVHGFIKFWSLYIVMHFVPSNMVNAFYKNGSNNILTNSISLDYDHDLTSTLQTNTKAKFSGSKDSINEQSNIDMILLHMFMYYPQIVNSVYNEYYGNININMMLCDIILNNGSRVTLTHKIRYLFDNNTLNGRDSSISIITIKRLFPNAICLVLMYTTTSAIGNSTDCMIAVDRSDHDMDPKKVDKNGLMDVTPIQESDDISIKVICLDKKFDIYNNKKCSFGKIFLN